jgi:2'-5' RNA ligase
VSERLFVAAAPPPGVVATLDDFLDPRRDAEPSFRWTVPEGWHLTCAFLPSVAAGLVEPLEEALGAVAARTCAFQVRVVGAGAFPDPSRAKALWLGVQDGAEPLRTLALRCRNAAAGCGIVVEAGRYHPHLTIARTRPLAARRWLGVLDAAPPLEWTVEDIVLFRSHLRPGGAGYETVATFPLMPGPPASQPTDTGEDFGPPQV